MKHLMLTIVLSIYGVSINTALKQTKCLSTLPNSIPRGVEVDSITDEVKFPSTTREPSSQSKISTKYDAKGLEPFFDLARSFMNTVQKKELPDMKDSTGGLDFDSNFKDLQDRKGKLYDFELPIGICTIIGILFALLMPLVGCCFCCCRCCGRCGGDMTQDDAEANSHCKCCIMALVLFVISVFLITGMAMMFVTNANLTTEVAGTEKTYDDALNEAWRYLNSIKRELKEITVNKTNCLFDDLIIPDISDQGVKELVGIPLKDKLQPNVIGPLNAVLSASNNVTAMKSALDVVANTSAELKSSATKLGNDLSKVKNDLERIKSDCNTAGLPCKDIQTDGLKQVANFTNLPSVDDELKNMGDIVNQNFSGSVDEAKKVFDDIPDTAVSKSSNTMKDVRKLTNDGREKVVNSTDSIYTKLDNIIKDKGKFDKYKADYIRLYTDKDKFRDYAFLALSCIMALIVALLTIGLVMGVIGYDRAKTPTNRSAASHHGGNMIMASVGFMFIFSLLFFFITACLFFVGEHLHIICRELENGKIIDKYASSSLVINKTQLIAENVIRNCRKGQSIYTAIDGKSIYDLNRNLNISKQVKIDETLDKLNVNLSDQTILSANTEKSLNDLKNSSVDNIDFAAFFTEIRKNIVAVNLTELATNLTQIADNINSSVSPTAAAIATDLRYVAGNLTEMENVTIRQIKGWTGLLEKNVEDLKVKAADVQTVAQNVLNELRTADNYIKVTAANDIKTIIKTYVKRVMGWPDQFLRHVLKELNENIASCKPIANIYDGILNVYLCNGIIGNVNGFWFAMGWCLFFFPFAIIFGVKLAKFLRIMRCKAEFDPYPGYEMQQHPLKMQLNDGQGSKASAPPLYP